MQRKLILAALAALSLLAGCAARDPNLAVKPLGEFGRAPADYTLRVNLYELDAKGRPVLAVRDDASLRGFVTRTLAARGYSLKASGPARYDLDVHLLCGNMRTADMGLMSEELRLPQDAVGQGYSGQLHYWLPDGGQSVDGAELIGLHESARRNRVAAGSSRPPQAQSRSAAGQAQPDFCQGRVLVLLTPSGAAPLREVFVGRDATEDCRAVAGCPVDTCRTALEHALVDLLERRL